MFAELLKPFAVPAVPVGIIAHGWAMFRKHRLQLVKGPQPAWETAAYWGCWALLAGLVAYAMKAL